MSLVVCFQPFCFGFLKVAYASSLRQISNGKLEAYPTFYGTSEVLRLLLRVFSLILPELHAPVPRLLVLRRAPETSQ